MRGGAGLGEQATLKLIQSGYCVACAAGMFPLAPLTFAMIFIAAYAHSPSCHAMPPAAPSFQDGFLARWVFDGADTGVPKVLVGSLSLRNQTNVVSKL